MPKGRTLPGTAVTTTTEGEAVINPLRIEGSTTRARDLNTQLEQLKRDHDILKSEIAGRMKIDPSYLSQLLQRGMAAEKIGQVAEAAEIAPQFFDEYVAKVAPEFLMQNPVLLDIVRALAFEADTKTCKRFYDMAQDVLKRFLDMEYGPSKPKRKKK